MSTEPLGERTVAVAALRMFSPALRAAVVHSSDFKKRFNLDGEPIVSLSPAGVRFRRSELIDVARKVLGGTTPQELRSQQGDAWLVVSGVEYGVTLSFGDVTCVVPEMACVSPNGTVRSGWFLAQAGTHAATSSLAAWQDTLARRPLADDEIEPLLAELRLVPRLVFASIREAMKTGSFEVTDIVPSDIAYYEQLVGGRVDSGGLHEYFSTTVAAHVHGLSAAGGGEGLKCALLLGSHSSLSDLIDPASIPKNEVIEAFAWLAASGDRMSQVAGIEFGLRLLGDLPELASSLASILHGLTADDPEDLGGRLQLTSGLIALVEGEVARLGLCRERPPFWRRLATIAHAGGLERAVIANGMDTAGVAKWAFNSGGNLFYFQTLVDLRREPRWHPDFISTQQLKAEWIGRVWSAAEKSRESVPPGELSDLLWGDAPTSVKSQLSFPEAWLPGPVEGGVEAVRDLPKDFDAEIRAGLEAEELTPRSFYGLVNTSLILRVDTRLSGFAAAGLRRVGYQLRRVAPGEDLFPLLNGLAKVAAVTRSVELASEVWGLVRAVRRAGSRKLSPEAAARIAVVACAASADLIPWSQAIGERLTELSFSEMTVEEAVSLRSALHMLLHIELDLWGTCGPAETALSAFIASKTHTKIPPTAPHSQPSRPPQVPPNRIVKEGAAPRRKGV